MEEFDTKLKEMLKEMADKGFKVDQMSVEYVGELGGCHQVVAVNYDIRSR